MQLQNITIFLSLVVCVLSAYADEKVASKPNFTTAINQYWQAHPVCIEIPAAEQYKFPITILPTHGQYYQGEPIMSAFLAKLGLLTAQATTVDVEEKNPLPSFSEKSRTPKIVQARGMVYELSELGKSAYRENVSGSAWSGKQHGFCYGEPRVVEIINYSEPADMFGQKISEVNFTYAIYNFASWADSDTIKQAAEQVLNSDADPSKLEKIMNANRLNNITDTITQHRQSIKTPLKAEAVLILTNSGWMHEKMFRQP